MTKRHLTLTLLIAGSLCAILSPGSSSAQDPARPAPPPAFPPTPAPAAPSPAELATPPAGALRLPTGVATLQLRPGSGAEAPRVHDLIVFRSIGRRPDGSVVQDGFAAKDPARLVVSRLNRGWQEGLVTMRVGEQKRFWFPAELMPLDKVTGRKEPVVFDIELLQIGRLPEPPRFLRQPDPKARKAGEGTSLLTLKPGPAGKSAVRTDGAMLSFTLWSPDGQVVSSSALDGRPTLFPLDKVMPSFADCVLGMTVGEQRQCWIPALHNDGFPNALKGDLIFQVELLALVDMAKLQGDLSKANKP